MPPAAAAAALHSSIPFSSSSSSSIHNSNSLRPNTVNTTKLQNALIHKTRTSMNMNMDLSLQFQEKILCLEIMGVDSGRALSRNPSLRTASLHSLHSIISFLQSKGIHQKDLGRIFGMCPTILTSSITAQIDPVFTFLSMDLQVPESGFRKVINKCPRLLASSVKDQLRPALAYLRRIGFTDLHALAYQDPILLVSSVERTLIPKLKYLESIGFLRHEAIGMVLRCPGLFTFSVENNFTPKFEYFSSEMEGTLKELREFPQYFAFSLEKRIKPRHMEVVRNGVTMPLAMMLKSTDEEFKELISQAAPAPPRG